MKTVSKKSKAGPDLTKASADADRARAAQRRRQRRRYYQLLAPPDVPHRRRDARRWMDEVTVLTLNGRVCERRPGQRLHTPSEIFAMSQVLRRALRRKDPELHRAVERLTFENVARDIGTLEEWKVRSARWSKRISRIRAEMQRAGLV